MKGERVFAFVLLGAVLTINLRTVVSYSKDTDNNDIIETPGDYLHKVIPLIPNAISVGATLGDGELPPADDLLLEDVTIFSEHVLESPEDTIRLDTDDANGGHANGDFKTDPSDIQSDTDLLYRDTKGLISVPKYGQTEIKTRIDVTFDRDSDRPKSQVGPNLEDSKRPKMEDVTTDRRKRRRRSITNTGESKGNKKGRAKAASRRKKVQDDQPNMSPLWRDPRCDEAPGRKSTSGAGAETTSMALARALSNNFNLSWLSCYLQSCPKCTSSSTGGNCPLTNQVLEMKKWANEVQELLTHGCAKPASCTYPGTCCIAADSMIEQMIVRIGEMLKDLHTMFHTKCVSCYNSSQGILGDWDSWSPWGSCDVTCGRASRSRFRGCVSENNCPGSPTETEPCAGLPDCCVDGNWANWESWAPCSVSCGRGQTTRIRRCSRPTPNSCGKACAGPREESRVCEGTEQCCVDGNWGRWSSWSACSSSCGEGRRTRARTCSSPPPSRCGQTCPGLAQEVMQCSDPSATVRGTWGAWHPWSTCSNSCGRGYRSRRRACDGSAPGACDRPCVGSDSETAICDTLDTCCINGNWGIWQPWSGCSTTCDSGARRRRRSCDNPPANHCGEKCPGDETQMTTCITGVSCLVCVNGNWGNWQEWNPCSVSCGLGNRERIRQCDNPSANKCGQRCLGRGFEVNACDTGRSCETCVNGQWGSWQPWSQCPVTCGRGVHERRRNCDDPPANQCGQPCPGIDRDGKECDSDRPCVICVNGNWGSWQTWSQCSVTCGRGTNERRRFCNDPEPNNCGSSCPGRAVDASSCETGVPCNYCVDGNWGDWQSWSGCSTTCGRGTRERRRACDNPPVNYCGKNCEGREFDTGVCNAGECLTCVDGNWGDWQSWSGCSTTCGRGTRERRRACDNPPVNYCGKNCEGREFDTGVCDAGECLTCVDGMWGPWRFSSPCSVTCEQGIRERQRSCDSPPNNYCGQKCPGPDYDTVDCDAGRECEFCVDGTWGSWRFSSPCSVTCGRGVRERQRSCDSPPNNYCGLKCPGPDYDTVVCDAGRECEFCVNGQWSPWSPWSGCAVSCGDGVVTRTRSCNSPPPNVCGTPCPGPSRDSRNQRCGPPSVDGGWSTWTSWSDCSVSCGTGYIIRSRNCNNPTATACGTRCVGQTDERQTCRGTGFCNCEEKEWSTWSPWSDCSATCGQAVRARSRVCEVTRRGDDCSIDCPGLAEENMTCQELPRCAVFASWGQWSPCSVTCTGRGYRERLIRTSRPVGRGDVSVETEEIRREREDCEITAPECPTWSDWSSCSVTCRGQGVRERIISTASSNITSGAINVDVASNATKKEVQNCIISEPECLYGDPGWTSWDSWCPCDCRRGIRSRRRECQKTSLQGLEPQVVPIAMCQGEARDEEACDTQLKCPECVSDCTDLTPGLYPSCASCSHYILCNQDGSPLILQCNPASDEFDAFVKKCVTPPSPSCTLHECITTCVDKLDGFYHICDECNSYIECKAKEVLLRSCPDSQSEWNQRTKRCEAGKSPTCMRQKVASFGVVIGGVLQRDSSQSSRYHETHERTESQKPTRRHQVLDGKQRPDSSKDDYPRPSKWKQNLDTKSTRLKPQQQSQDISKVVGCKTNCYHTNEGRYPSCRGCQYYVICTWDGQLQHKRCSGDRDWDDSTKSCRLVSSTCTRDH